MLSAVERAHDLEPNGNIVVTFHSNNSLPELDTRVPEGKGEVSKELIIFNERENQAQRLRPKENFFLGEIPSPKAELNHLNKESWIRELSQLSFHTEQGENAISKKIREFSSDEKSQEKLNGKTALEIYKLSKTPEGQKEINSYAPEAKEYASEMLNTINYGEIYLRESYVELQNQFNKAWQALKNENTAQSKKDLEKLEQYRKHIKTIQDSINFKDPQNLLKVGEEIQKGVNILSNLKESPKTWRPMGEFITDKSSESFANIALKAYKQFGYKREKDTTPIISIENPPAGGALSRGEDLKKLVDESRKKFIQKAQKELGLSESEARKKAEQIIGVTWDVGHINMLRKFGYDKDALVKQTEKVAPYIKHIHLSDNFGFEHTELPMGMGDVPLKEHLKAIGKYNKQLGKLKQVVETGTWFKDFKITPFKQTLEAFGSPVYAMSMAPYWNQAANASGGYFSGYGQMLPQQHFNLYGAGFSTLPPELGGSLGGQSRVSGNPID